MEGKQAMRKNVHRFASSFNKPQIMQNSGTFLYKRRCSEKFDGENPRRLNL